jgi:hypothetical protein
VKGGRVSRQYDPRSAIVIARRRTWLRGLAIAQQFQTISPQRRAPYGQLTRACVLIPAINVRLPHAPPAGLIITGPGKHLPGPVLF